MTSATVTPTLTPARKAKLELRLSKAKTNLVLSHPFVGTIALGMPYILSFDVPTAATNGVRVLFNPDFIEPLADDELLFLVAHECFHPMLEHTTRRGGRHRRKWNMAGDYVINKLLTDEGIGRMSKGGLLSPSIYQAGGGTTDGIYAMLPEQPDDDDSYGGNGDPLDDCEDAPGSPAEAAQQAAEWKVKVAQAAQAAKMMGKMSANMQRLVESVLAPKVDWRTVLQRFLVKARTDSRSWARFNRRFLPQGMYLPSISGEQMGEIVFAVDCSGSIGQAELDQFAAEMRVVKDDLMPARIHVLYFDTAVCHADVFDPDNELTVAPHGGGGTDFAPVFEHMVEHGIDPVAVVFLTDLCCSSFGNEPACPVLWVTTHPGKAPFGEIVEM